MVKVTFLRRTANEDYVTKLTYPGGLTYVNDYPDEPHAG